MTNLNKLTGTLVYVQVDQPRNCYVAEKGQEWKASIVVDEETADAWDEAFPKQSAKNVKTSEFEEIYKIPAPFPDQRKQHIITLRKNTKLANGNDVPLQYQPKVFEKKGTTLVEITKSVLVANGSEGALSVDLYEGKMGNVARLKNILVTSLIPYEKPERDNAEPGSEFGDVAPVASSEKQESKPAAKSSAKKSKPADDEDSPF